MSKQTLNQGSQPERKPGFNQPADNSGMRVSAVVPVSVKYVDGKEFDGARGGDTRAKGANAVLPNNPALREAVGQFPLSGKQAAASAPIVTDNDEGVGG
jgi:hypothetical protein